MNRSALIISFFSILFFGITTYIVCSEEKQNNIDEKNLRKLVDDNQALQKSIKLMLEKALKNTALNIEQKKLKGMEEFDNTIKEIRFLSICRKIRRGRPSYNNQNTSRTSGIPHNFEYITTNPNTTGKTIYSPNFVYQGAYHHNKTRPTVNIQRTNTQLPKNNNNNNYEITKNEKEIPNNNIHNIIKQIEPLTIPFEKIPSEIWEKINTFTDNYYKNNLLRTTKFFERLLVEHNKKQCYTKAIRLLRSNIKKNDFDVVFEDTPFKEFLIYYRDIVGNKKPMNLDDTYKNKIIEHYNENFEIFFLRNTFYTNLTDKDILYKIKTKRNITFTLEENQFLDFTPCKHTIIRSNILNKIVIICKEHISRDLLFSFIKTYQNKLIRIRLKQSDFELPLLKDDYNNEEILKILAPIIIEYCGGAIEDLLSYLCTKEKFKALSFLIKCNAYINCQVSHGNYTPLYNLFFINADCFKNNCSKNTWCDYCCKKYEILKLSIKHGADLTIKSGSETPLDRLKEKYPNIYAQYMLEFHNKHV